MATAKKLNTHNLGHTLDKNTLRKHPFGHSRKRIPILDFGTTEICLNFQMHQEKYFLHVLSLRLKIVIYGFDGWQSGLSERIGIYKLVSELRRNPNISARNSICQRKIRCVRRARRLSRARPRSKWRSGRWQARSPSRPLGCPRLPGNGIAKLPKES